MSASRRGPHSRVTVRILTGDSRELLTTLPDESVDCIITSPPYFGLRSYLKKTDPQKVKELGLEPTIAEWLANQMQVFGECHRVLKKRGVMWVNIADSYYSPRYNGGIGVNSKINGKGSHEALRVGQAAKRGQASAHIHELGGNRRPQVGLKPKDRMGIPHRLVFALQDFGWWWRDEVVWAKTNTMPESTKDRTTKAHEFLFMLTKAQRYYFDQRAYREPAVQEEIALGFRGGSYTHDTVGPRTSRGNYRLPNGPTKSPYGQGFTRRAFPPVGVAPDQPRSRHQGRKPVAGWNMQAGAGAHETKDHARAQDGQKQSTKFGREAGWRKQGAEVTGTLTRNKRSWWPLPTQPFKGKHYATFPTWLIEPCVLSSCPVDGIVLDPYGGVGTVSLVAERHQRNSILMDLNADSCEEAYWRIRDAAPLITNVEVCDAEVRDRILRGASGQRETHVQAALVDGAG